MCRAKARSFGRGRKRRSLRMTIPRFPGGLPGDASREGRAQHDRQRRKGKATPYHPRGLKSAATHARPKAVGRGHSVPDQRRKGKATA